MNLLTIDEISNTPVSEYYSLFVSYLQKFSVDQIIHILEQPNPSIPYGISINFRDFMDEYSDSKIPLALLSYPFILIPIFDAAILKVQQLLISQFDRSTVQNKSSNNSRGSNFNLAGTPFHNPAPANIPSNSNHQYPSPNSPKSTNNTTLDTSQSSFIDSQRTKRPRTFVQVPHTSISPEPREESENNSPRLIYKPFVHSRVYSLGFHRLLIRTTLPNSSDLNLFLQMTGIVIRVAQPTSLVYQRTYECTKCGCIFNVRIDPYLGTLTPPPACPSNSAVLEACPFITVESLHEDSVHQQLYPDSLPVETGFPPIPIPSWEFNPNPYSSMFCPPHPSPRATFSQTSRNHMILMGSKECKARKFIEIPETSLLRDVQHVKLQEQIENVHLGVMPRAIQVILEDDMVDLIQAGDSVELCGVVIGRWNLVRDSEPLLLDPIIVATHIKSLRQKEDDDDASQSVSNLSPLQESVSAFSVHPTTPENTHPGSQMSSNIFGNSQLTSTHTSTILKTPVKVFNQLDCLLQSLHLPKDFPRPKTTRHSIQLTKFYKHWLLYKTDPLAGRNFVLNSICPQICGLFLVKLALLITLISGIQRDTGFTKVRGNIHLLLVGDPGTGKSQFLRFAQKIARRAIFTTGIGTTKAGLTCTAVQEDGHWALEAGALVLSDGGVCCIDEFGQIANRDITIIQEAMEQQTITVTKAGLVCQLQSRCSVIAATNAKGKYDPSESIAVNTALCSPLLSRFDICLTILDTRHEEFDKMVSTTLLERVLEHGYDLREKEYERYQATQNLDQSMDSNDSESGDRDDRSIVGGAKSLLFQEQHPLRIDEQSQQSQAMRYVASDASSSNVNLHPNTTKQKYPLFEPINLEDQMKFQSSQEDMDDLVQGSHKFDMPITFSQMVTSAKKSKTNQNKTEYDKSRHIAEPDLDTWSISLLREYIEFVSEYFYPKLNSDSRIILDAYFTQKRSQVFRQAARTTMRMLESLIRIAQAHARLMFRHDWIVRQDAIVAIILLEASNHHEPLLGVTEVRVSTFPDKPDEEYLQQERMILKHLKLEHLLDEEVDDPVTNQ